MSGALDGIRVIDFGQYIAGPLAAMMLADNGADVVRVDPPGGPLWRNGANAALQRGKRSIVLDLKSDADKATARELVASADVAVENFRPGVMDRLGLGVEAMTAANSRLVYCSLPGFGRDDPRAGLAGWEGIIQSAAGVNFIRGFNAGPALSLTYFATPLASSYAAFVAAHSIVAALIARERGGAGQSIEVPLFAAVLQMFGSMQFHADGKFVAAMPPSGVYRGFIGRHMCKDGRWVDMSPPWRGVKLFCEAFLPKEVNESGILADPNPESQAKVTKMLEELFLTKTALEWEHAIEAIGAGCTVCQTSQEWLHDEHALDSRCAIKVADPELGETHQLGYPVTLAKTPSETRSGRHVLDADHAAVLAEAGVPASSANGAAGAERPLSGMRVVDISQVLAGPTAGRVLAAYGAEVIKVNNPDLMANSSGTMSHTFTNSGKKTILVDLKSEAGMDILWRLVEKADVFHQNFGRPSAKRLGVSEADVREHKADIIYSSVNTHADGGFRKDFIGHEELGQAVTGLENRLGGDSMPQRAGWPVCDYATGHLSAFGILLALYHRLRTGEGQHVQASLSQSATYLQSPFMVDFPGQTWEEPTGMDARGRGPLYCLHEASDRWFFLAVPEPGDLTRLAKIQGLAGLESLSGEALTEALAERFKSAPAETWVERINTAGLAAHLTMDAVTVLKDPGLRDRGLTILREHEGLGLVSSVSKPAFFSRTPLDDLFPAPIPGGHTRQVVQELGLGDALEELLAKGVVATPEPVEAKLGSLPVRAPAGS